MLNRLNKKAECYYSVLPKRPSFDYFDIYDDDESESGDVNGCLMTINQLLVWCDEYYDDQDEQDEPYSDMPKIRLEAYLDLLILNGEFNT